MSPSIPSIADGSLLAAIAALEPMSYIIRVSVASVAFGAAMNNDKVLARVLGLVWLLITGASLLIIGIHNKTLVDILLGPVALGAAGYSWWYTQT